MNWLLLRGLTRETRHWGDVETRLKNEYPDFQILSLDLPGAGKKHSEIASTSTPDYVADLRAEFLSQKKEGPWSILAISMGGMIAMEWANQYPSDFSLLIIINSSAANIATPIERFKLNNLSLALKMIFSKDIQEKELAILKHTINLKLY